MAIFFPGLFNFKSGANSASFISGSDGTTEVDTYADLPAAALNTNKLAWVRTTTGVAFVNRKISGWYRSTGSTWVPAEIATDEDSEISTDPTGRTHTTAVTVEGALDELDAAIGSGSVTTTGSPASGNLTKFSGTTSITNGDLSGDVTTGGALSTTVAKIQGTTVSGTTGTVNVVFSNSPTLVTPALGTPSSLVGTNITGTAAGLTSGTVTTNANLTGAVTSIGNATSLGSFSSANLAGAVTDETGTGALVFSNTPTIVTPVINGTVTGTGVSQSSSASTLVQRDSNSNVFGNVLVPGFTSTTSSGGTTSMTVASTGSQYLTGTSAHQHNLPNATTLSLGWQYSFNNNSTNTWTIANNGGTAVYSVVPGGFVNIYVTDVSSANGTWDAHPLMPSTSSWGSSSAGLFINTQSTTTPSIRSGTPSSTLPAFVPQRGSSTTGYSGDSTHLYGIIAGTASWTSTATTFNIPSGSTYQINGSQIAASNLSNGTTGSGSVVLATSPTLTSPNLDTPTTLVGTNITGTAAGLTAGNVTTNANLTGAITSVGNATSLGSFTSANLAGALTDETGSGAAVFATSPTLVTPALGTPSALVGTNITGTAAGLTAGNVTTNANLTGPITSVGNATAIASQTGTGTKFVVDTSPTLITPNIGVATGTSLAASGVMSTGANSGTNGQITFNGSTSGSVAVKSAAAAGTGTVFQLPSTNGTNAFVLQTDGTGVTSWVAQSGGGVTAASVWAAVAYNNYGAF